MGVFTGKEQCEPGVSESGRQEGSFLVSPNTQSLSPMPYFDLSPSLSPVPCCYGNREAEYAAKEAGPADLACLHGDWGSGGGTFFKPHIWTPGSSQLCLLPGIARENLSTYLLPLLTPWPAGMSQDHGEGGREAEKPGDVWVPRDSRFSPPTPQLVLGNLGPPHPR